MAALVTLPGILETSPWRFPFCRGSRGQPHNNARLCEARALHADVADPSLSLSEVFPKSSVRGERYVELSGAVFVLAPSPQGRNILWPEKAADLFHFGEEVKGSV
jgi:hypothetical protein